MIFLFNREVKVHEKIRFLFCFFSDCVTKIHIDPLISTDPPVNEIDVTAFFEMLEEDWQLHVHGSCEPDEDTDDDDDDEVFEPNRNFLDAFN